MRKVLAILISVQILSASFFLPKGDFGILMQLPQIISSYKQVNGDVGIFDFFEEEFFDKATAFSEENDQNNPFEKESKPVPIDFFVSGIFCLCYYSEPAAVCLTPVVQKTENNTPYIEYYPSTDLNSIFHPPEYQG